MAVWKDEKRADVLAVAMDFVKVESWVESLVESWVHSLVERLGNLRSRFFKIAIILK